MAMLGALSVAAWLWQGRAQHVAALRNDSPSTSSADMRRMPAVMMELSGTWRERFDAGTGAPYWINIETGLSTDVRPTSPAGTVGTTSAQKQESPTVGSPGTVGTT